MTKEQVESLEKLKRQILIGECEKNIGIPVFISDLKNILAMIEEKDKQIGLYIDNIMIHQQVKTIRKMCCTDCQIKACTYSGIHRNCIKQYFENKAKEV